MSYRAMLMVLILSFPAAIGAVLAYHVLVAPRPVGMVDAAGLWKSGQSATAQALVRPESTDEQRRAALVDAQRFGERLQTALNQVAEECRCVLVTSSAVLAGKAPDYTGSVARRLAVAATPVATHQP